VKYQRKIPRKKMGIFNKKENKIKGKIQGKWKITG
jgi:hypothetical protein